jgi:apyrase
MFASYWKVDLLGEPTNGAKAVLIPLNLPPLQLIREDPPIPRGLGITRTGSGGSSLLPGNYYSSWQHWWSKWGRAFGFLAIAALLLFLGFLLGRMCWQKEALQFAVIIDCGSTGTCVDVYAWALSHTDPLPVMVRPTYSHTNWASWYIVKGQQHAYKQVETEPGLDEMLHNGTALTNALVPLLKCAEKQIPPYAHATTQLFLLATAGLRRLPPEDSEWILDNAWSELEKSSFKCDRRQVKVISGVEEVYYGWISLNYNFGKLGHVPKLSNFSTWI